MPLPATTNSPRTEAAPVSKQTNFAFDPTASPAENITRFLDHMAGIDAEMAAILRASIGTIIPFPSDAKRGKARAEFNRVQLT